MPPSGELVPTPGHIPHNGPPHPLTECHLARCGRDAPPAKACTNHKPVQHRDGKEPWCKECGLTARGFEPHSRLGQAAHEAPNDRLAQALELARGLARENLLKLPGVVELIRQARFEVADGIALAIKARRDEARAEEHRGWPLLTDAWVIAVNARNAAARDADSARREALRAQYGQPVTVDAAEALRVLGEHMHLAPADVVAFRYRDQEGADAYAASNLEHYGHPSLGTYVVPDGVVGVIDLRQARRVLGWE